MNRKVCVAGAFAVVAFALPSRATENSGTHLASVQGLVHRTVVCRGLQNVPITADAEQALPLRLVSQLSCGAEVAMVSDSGGYTVQVQTAEGKSGYIARVFLSESPANSRTDRGPIEAAEENGIARWQAGAPGSDKFFSGDSLVESLTANGITVQVSLSDTDWKLRASVAIVNNSASPVQFNPASFTLDELTPRLRSLAYQNPRELARALTHQVYWTNSSATAPPSAVYSNAAYRTSQYVPPTPNYLAQQAQQTQAPVLQTQALAPRDKTSGVVWFQRDKNARELNLRIFVNDQIFEFPLSFPQHR